MNTRPLGPFQVSAIGLGCMNLSYAYGVPPDEAYGARVLMTALEAGVTHFDTAALYGFGVNETLVGKTLKAHRAPVAAIACDDATLVSCSYDGAVVVRVFL